MQVQEIERKARMVIESTGRRASPHLTPDDPELRYTMHLVAGLECDDTTPEGRALNLLNSRHIRRKATILHHFRWIEEFFRP